MTRKYHTFVYEGLSLDIEYWIRIYNNSLK
jgi:hypothetical protein